MVPTIIKVIQIAQKPVQNGRLKRLLRASCVCSVQTIFHNRNMRCYLAKGRLLLGKRDSLACQLLVSVPLPLTSTEL